MAEQQYVISLGCPDRTGIVARIAGFLAEAGGWITEADYQAQRSGPCHQPQTGLLFLVSGAPEISPKTGLATENGVKPNFLTCENAPL